MPILITPRAATPLDMPAAAFMMPLIAEDTAGIIMHRRTLNSNNKAGSQPSRR